MLLLERSAGQSVRKSVVLALLPWHRGDLGSLDDLDGLGHVSDLDFDLMSNHGKPTPRR